MAVKVAGGKYVGGGKGGGLKILVNKMKIYLSIL